MLWLKLQYIGNVLTSHLSPQSIQLKEETSGDKIPFLVWKEACLDVYVVALPTQVTPDSQQEG